MSKKLLVTVISQAVSLEAKADNGESKAETVKIGEKVVVDKMSGQLKNLQEMGILKVREAVGGEAVLCRKIHLA